MARRYLALLLAAAFLPWAAFAAPGDLDPGFNTDGKVTTDFGDTGNGPKDGFGRSVAVQSDGKIVVAGYLKSGFTHDNDFVVVRYRANGSPDTSFGTNGIVTTDFGSGTSGDFGYAVAVQSDGKIVVAGQSWNDSNGSLDVAVVRYNPDGSLDPSFGTGGKVTTDFGSTVDSGTSVAVQSDGKIVVAGYSGHMTSADSSSADFAVVRYNADGTLDSSFGTGGKVTTDFGASGDFGYTLAVQGDGKIVVAGYSGLAGEGYSSSTDFAVVRYNTDGSLDTSFGTGGKITTDFGASVDLANSVAVQSDGKIVAAGSVIWDPNNPSTVFNESDFAVVRYNADGTRDPSFGTDGKVTTDFGNPFDVGSAVVVQSDGRIVVAGRTYIFGDFAVVRYDADGSLDPSFGTGGKITTAIGSGADSAYAVALQSDGKIVVAGDAFQTGFDFAVARYLVGDIEPGCGNGVTEAGEDCDDGDTVDGDCCSSTCQFEAAGSPCPSDATVCTVDGCDGSGVCIHAFPPGAGCAPARALKGGLAIKNNVGGLRDSLTWTWKASGVVPKADFGNPLVGTGYTLCVADATGLLWSATVPASGTCLGIPCWREITKGFKYSDGDPAPNGVSRMDLKEGLKTGTAKEYVKSKGPFLAPPALPLTPPVTARLHRNDAATCWEANYSLPVKNDPLEFKAKND